MRLMSNNQWKQDDNLETWVQQGMDCSAEHREKGFAQVYEKTLPDVIGLQEVSGVMLDYLTRYMAKDGLYYTAVWGRDTPILYRPDRFALLDQAYGIYPHECPGYAGDFNNADTKSWNIAVLQEKASGKTFAFTSTHLWWMSDHPDKPSYQYGSNAARVYQMGLISDEIAKMQAAYNCPAVLVGDMNCRFVSDPIQLAFNRGFVHANTAAKDYAYPYDGYHWCGADGYVPYEPKPFEEAIDHILLKPAPDGRELTVSRFDRYIADSYLPLSDHFPAWIDAEL